jgi:hypothetical protein
VEPVSGKVRFASREVIAASLGVTGAGSKVALANAQAVNADRPGPDEVCSV